MTSLYMLDTNTVSYIVKRQSPEARRRLFALQSGEIASISAITEAEIRYGIAKKPEASALKSLIDAFLASIQVLPWGRNEAEVYGRVRATQERRGISLANMDMLIAAHAIAAEAVLVTNDKVFAQINELSATVNWATDL
ncbi:MAG TPA: type II toxin-antitoxin system VapC family toxin [Acidobacteriaceae bacterium]|nr:type II toxin-antitoxin system VapC family toxin [Acidobacteriaceae bacterium]